MKCFQKLYFPTKSSKSGSNEHGLEKLGQKKHAKSPVRTEARIQAAKKITDEMRQVWKPRKLPKTR